MSYIGGSNNRTVSALLALATIVGLGAAGTVASQGGRYGQDDADRNAAAASPAPSPRPARNPKAEAEQARRDAAARTEANDRSIVAERGWSDGDFVLPLSTDAAAPGGTGGPIKVGSLGPFRLGMTIGEVRRAARKARVYSIGMFHWSGQTEDGWCAPPQQPGGKGVALAPKQLNMRDGRMRDYTLEFLPVGRQLRLATIASDKRSVGIDLLALPSTVPPFKTCRLTSREERLLAGWDRLENSVLIDRLGSPRLGDETLPTAVRVALERWEKSVAVDEPQYSLGGSIDGWWTDGDTVVTAFLFAFSADPYSGMFSYVVVTRPDGTILWSGEMREFERAGVRGQQGNGRIKAPNP